MRGLTDRLEDLNRVIAEWSNETFGDEMVRGPIGPLKHLEREAREAVEAFKPQSSKRGEFLTELADCLILVLDSTRRGGMPLSLLLEAAELKMDINKSREWPKPTSDEPVEHIRD